MLRHSHVAGVAQEAEVAARTPGVEKCGLTVYDVADMVVHVVLETRSAGTAFASALVTAKSVAGSEAARPDAEGVRQVRSW